MESGKITQLDTVKEAKKLGINAIEVVGITPHDGSTPKEYARKIREEADKENVAIANFAIGADLINGTNGRTPDEEIAYVKEMVDIAEILGAKSMRHDIIHSVGEYRSFDGALPVLSERIREISTYAGTKGVKTMVENHGYICQDPDRLERLFNSVNHENFALLCDIGNFACADCNSVTSVSVVAPYAAFVHVKDFYFKSGSCKDTPGEGFFMTRGKNFLKGSPVGHGVIPVTQCLEILKSAGYDGYLSIEYEGKEDALEGIKIGKENLERYISSIS